MNIVCRMVVAAGLSLILSSNCFAADPVPLPCDPEDCPPIDPCEIAPEKCKDKGGPIGVQKDTSGTSVQQLPASAPDVACVKTCNSQVQTCYRGCTAGFNQCNARVGSDHYACQVYYDQCNSGCDSGHNACVARCPDRN